MKNEELRIKNGDTMIVDLTGLPAGVYTLKVETSRGRGLAKVVKR